MTLVVAACGSSGSDDDESASADAETTTTTEEQTTTTAESTTTTEATTTTTAVEEVDERGVLDLRELGIREGLITLDADYQELFAAGDISGETDASFLPRPCGEPLDYSYFQRVAYGYVYPHEELGWPEEGAVVDILLIAHQALPTEDVVLTGDFLAAIDGCSALEFPWEPSPTGAVGVGLAFDSPQIDGIEEAVGYYVVTADGIVWMQYAFSTDDLGVTLLMQGAVPGAVEDLQALADPIVEFAQEKVVECLATPKCRDFNNN